MFSPLESLVEDIETNYDVLNDKRDAPGAKHFVVLEHVRTLSK